VLAEAPRGRNVSTSNSAHARHYDCGAELETTERLNFKYGATQVLGPVPISFRRGVRTSIAVQIDHVVALADAWRSGGVTLDGR
jgi:hypothetical protein